ncbi:MAG: hypothetical protein Q7I95_07955 [Thiobacillus sp.]|nr:hypothetical protein [Thiobacillus sp.]MDP1644658.1 hypothetical protein [Thiobacillus sp.]
MVCIGVNPSEAERMSHPARGPHSGIDGQANAAGSRFAVVAADVGSVVRPGRVRNRTKTEPEEKVKKPADGVRKKTPPARKAPARGRYVDEYARPSA